MARLLWLVLLICVQQSWSQDSSSTEASKDDSDPVALLLSSLRSLVENPGAPFEDGYEFFPLEEGRRREPMYGKPREDYFKRIKENYGKLQKNIGSVLEDLSLPKNIFGVDVKSKEGSTKVDVKVPFFPVQVKVKHSKTQSPKEPVTQVPSFLDVFHKQKEDSVAEKSTKVGVSIPQLPLEVKVKSEVETAAEDDSKSSTEEPRKVRPQLSKVSTKVKVGDFVKVKVESEAKVVKRFGQQPSSLIELGESSETTGRFRRDTIPTEIAPEAQKEVFTKTYYDLMMSNSDDEDVQVDIIEDSNSGRILGEVLYSEEAFDNITKEAIKNAKWALDANLDFSKVLDKLDAVARLLKMRSRTKSKSKRTPGASRPQSAFDVSKLPHLDLSAEEEYMKRDLDRYFSEQETVMYALTPTGVPVQIRVGPEVENPYTYLHGVLSAAEVVLKVRVGADTDWTPDSEGLPAPVLHVDMSDTKQRGSFLRTLKLLEAGGTLRVPQ